MQLVVAVDVGAQVGGAGGNGLVRVGADLELLCAEGAVQQPGAVEFGGLRDAVQFTHQLPDLGLQRLPVAGAVGGVGRLHGQFAYPLQDVAGTAHGALGRLRQRDTVVGITCRLLQTTDLCGEALRDCQTSGIVLGAVDAQTG